jgi:pyruvate dehydrogenase E1 component
MRAPGLDSFEALLQGTGERAISTTMAFVRALAMILRDRELKEHVVPIVADEARTFGMEGMFRQLGIYANRGQLYTPVDSDQLMFYKEDRKGQILQEGITEAGAMSSWIAAATSYSSNGVPMIPFFIFYSMFGFQRVGDLAWAAGDLRARGFLIGGTSGRTTLNGEGLQHEDGHSHMLSAQVPNCVSYDPTFTYELVVILQDGLRRMYQEQEDVYFYVTVMNENYPHPEMPAGADEGIRRGLYQFREGEGDGPRVQLLGSGAILREVIAAADLLAEEFGVVADVWSATSFTELRRDGEAVARHNRLNPDQEQKCWVGQCLEGREGPAVAATDYVSAFPDQVRAFVPQDTYIVLGTDGFGRSDTRESLRRFFEVDRRQVAYAALYGLFRQGKLDRQSLLAAREQLGIDPQKPNPFKV